MSFYNFITLYNFLFCVIIAQFSLEKEVSMSHDESNLPPRVESGVVVEPQLKILVEAGFAGSVDQLCPNDTRVSAPSVPRMEGKRGKKRGRRSA